ncbi:unnamed protein product [Pieris macdunnoughi]|uniref:Integrase zinc-binding domain-containing protein n=1 Tax=Pieris macdunnoughi TaxID=345717 RepID=A0A821RYB3_9NEOP|nr:unnamed protein product [Pieris macdunnoughi]
MHCLEGHVRRIANIVQDTKEEQQQDSDIKPILDWMKSSAIKPRWNDVASTSTTTKSYWAQWDSLVLHNGVLCRKWENTRGDASHLQLVVPRSKVRNILEMFHDGSSGGHLGVKRTLLKIKREILLDTLP